jgi:hypothetical protein
MKYGIENFRNNSFVPDAPLTDENRHLRKKPGDVLIIVLELTSQEAKWMKPRAPQAK